MAYFVLGPFGEAAAAGTVRLHLPDVPSIIDQHGLVALGPAGEPERGHLLPGRGQVQVDERPPQPLGDVARLPAGEVVAPPVLALEPHHVAALRTSLGRQGDPFADQRLGPRPRIHRVQVVELLVEHGVHVVGGLVTVEDVAFPLQQRGLIGAVAAEHQEAPVSQVPRADLVALPQLTLPHPLLRDRIDIEGVPDLYAGPLLLIVVACVPSLSFLSFALLILFALGIAFPGIALRFVTLRLLFALSFIFRYRNPLLVTEEEDGSVPGPGGRAVLDHALSGKQRRGFARIENEGLALTLVEVPPRQRYMRRVLVLVVGVGLEHGQVRRLLAPGELPVLGLARVQRADAARLGIIEADPVAHAVLGVHRHRQQMSLVLPRERGDVAEADRGARSQTPHDGVRSRTLLLLRLVAPQREVPPVSREGEGRNVLDRLLLARTQVQQPHVVAHRFATLLQRLPLVGGDADRVGEPPPVLAEPRASTEGDHHHRVGIGAVDAQLVFVVDPADADREPEAIGRERRLTQGLPLAVVVGGERGLLLRGCLCGARGADGEDNEQMVVGQRLHALPPAGPS